MSQRGKSVAGSQFRMVASAKCSNCSSSKEHIKMLTQQINFLQNQLLEANQSANSEAVELNSKLQVENEFDK